MRNSMQDKAAELMEQSLRTAKGLGASAAKVHFSQGERIGCQFEGGKLKSADSRQSISYEVEVLAGGRRGVAGGNDLADLKEIVARAAALARTGSAAHFSDYPLPAPLAKVKMHSPLTAAMSRETLIENCRRMVEDLKRYEADLFIEASASRGESEGLLMTSSGVRHEHRATRWSLGAYAQRTEGTDMLFSGCSRGWRDVNEFFDPALIVQRILEDLRDGRQIAEPPIGPVTVLLCPEMFHTLLYPLLLGVNGRNVAKGDSPLRGRLGRQVLDPCLTILDDPHLDYCDGAAVIDGDGVPTAPLPIVKGGVLENFLYDLDTAGLAGAAPTGHDGCSPHALSVLAGGKTHQELLESIDDGLYVKGLIGFGQSNVLNGDFSSNVALGFRIRKGKVLGRVKNTMIAGNVYELLKADVQLSSDRDENIRMPYAVIQGATCSAAKK